MKALKRILILVACLAGLGARAELTRETYTATRAMGMGNAFIALADDYNALWYNPAALAYIRGNHVNLIDATLQVDGMNTLGRIGNALFDGDHNNLIRNDLQSMAFALRPSFVTKYFGISFFNNASSFTDFRDLTTLNAAVDIDLHNDVGIILGGGFPFSDYLAFGASLRVFQRSGIDLTLDTAGLIASIGVPTSDFQTAVYQYLKDQLGLGWAVGVNFGGMAKIPIFGKKGPEWTLGLQVENVGQTKFRRLGGRNALPHNLPMVYNVGTAFKYTLSKKSSLSLTADYRRMVERGINANKKIHIGLEFKGPGFDIRTGLNQLYPTFGIGLRLPSHTRINFATYAVELGDDFLERNKRLYEIQVVMGFNPL